MQCCKPRSLGKQYEVAIKEDKKNHLFCMDFNKSGQYFAVAGKEPKILVYDDCTRKLLTELDAVGSKMAGHTNRIFSVKFDPNSNNLLCSGGWDSNVYFWDIRDKKSISNIFGPYIGGDGLDIFGDQLLTASARTKDALQLWDIRKNELLETLDWNDGLSSAKEGSSLFCAQFSKMNGDYIIAGGSDRNMAKVFDTRNMRVIAAFDDFEKPCLVVDSSYDGLMFLMGSGEGKVRIKNMISE